MPKTVDVASGQKIASTWGNEIRDRTVQLFVSVAERDASGWAPANGAMCVTQDTGILWQRVAGSWQSRRPMTVGGVANQTTDGFGNLGVTGLPGGIKWIGAVATSASTSFPALVVVNGTDGPPGGPNVIFNVRHPDGSPWASAFVAICYVVTYTM